MAANDFTFQLRILLFLLLKRAFVDPKQIRLTHGKLMVESRRGWDGESED